MKNKVVEIIWWESCITEHQIHTLAALSLIPNVKVTIYALSFENSVRKLQGWGECDWTMVDINLIPSSAYVFIINRLKTSRNSVHIFGGPFDSFKITFALLTSLFIGNRTFVLTEPYSPLATGLFINGNPVKNWFLKMMRPLKYRLLWSLLKTRIEGVFAISMLAISQLISFGVCRDKILPYAYFVPSKSHSMGLPDVSVATNTNESLKIIFVGSLNYLKGIDLAINTVNKLKDKGMNVTLDVYGPSNRVNDYFWSSNVHYRGIIPFGAAESKIAEYDLLILPSRYDGWGVVVNEALLAGVPVLCSNQAGASSLIKRWRCGICYDSWNENSLKECIKDIYYNKESRLKEFGEHVQQARDVISPKSGAEFILHSIKSADQDLIGKESSWYL